MLSIRSTICCNGTGLVGQPNRAAAHAEMVVALARLGPPYQDYEEAPALDISSGKLTLPRFGRIRTTSGGMGRVLASIILFCVSLCPLSAASQTTKLRDLLNGALATDAPQTKIDADPQVAVIEVTAKFPKSDAPRPFRLDVTATRPNPNGITLGALPLTQGTVFLNTETETAELALTQPETDQRIYLDASLRDAQGNLLAQLRQPFAYPGDTNVYLELEPLTQTNKAAELPDIFAVERIAGTVTLPRQFAAKSGSILYVQLLESAMAGANRLRIEADTAIPLTDGDREIAYTLERGLFDRPNTLALGLKAWVEGPTGRKSHIMSEPVTYNGPDLTYDLRLDSLRQGQDTKRGRNLPSSLMAQTLVQGEASFDPVNGIPGQARLKIVLTQDRGAYNPNPVLAEQTLLLRGMETTLPFSLTTDSTHFDPYAPAPFLSVALTDRFGRVYYESGEIRAREGANAVRLFPR